MSGQQGRELRATLSELFQVQTGHVQFLGVGRVLEQVESFLVGGRFFLGNVTESKVVVGGFVREEHAIVEGKLAAQVMAKDDVRQFVRKHHREAGLVRKRVNQSAADDDGVAHAKGFERRSEHHTRANRAGQLNVVGDFQVADDRHQNLVNVAIRSEQAGILQAGDNVVL